MTTINLNIGVEATPETSCIPNISQPLDSAGNLNFYLVFPTSSVGLNVSLNIYKYNAM
jgi:hypothetical protein